MLMVEFRACNNNQCPIDWFKMQAKTTCFKQSNYCLTNEPCNRRRNTVRHSNISFLVVTHDNNSRKKNCILG
jgi:hypothetical protein